VNGAGLIGCRWTVVFACVRRAASVYDSLPGAAERAIATIAAWLDDLVLAYAPSVFSRFRLAAMLLELLAGAVYTQKSVFEHADTKRDTTASKESALPTGASGP